MGKVFGDICCCVRAKKSIVARMIFFIVYRYGTGPYGFDFARHKFFVLRAMDMETSARPHPASPGWSCPNRNWQSEFDWVIGAFEK